MVDKLSIKDKLVQYEDIKKEISRLEYKIDKLEKKGFVAAAVEESRHKPPFGKHSILIEATNHEIAKKIQYYKSLLKLRLDDLIKAQIEVEEYINCIPTSRLRTIFELRYFNQYSWRKIAYVLKGRATEETVRKEHEKYLKNE